MGTTKNKLGRKIGALGLAAALLATVFSGAEQRPTQKERALRVLQKRTIVRLRKSKKTERLISESFLIKLPSVTSTRTVNMLATMSISRSGWARISE